MDEAIRVLHVDDEPAMGNLVATFLEREDDRFVVLTETSATDGLDRLTDAAVDIDCIISDYQMPGKDGLDFLNSVRETHPDLPFILFTGRGSEEVASDALATGATDYLQKDTGTEQYELLANRVKNAVERYRARERAVYLERVRTIVRDVNQALVRATSRQAIETHVCEIISEPDAVRFVVFSAVDPETDRIEPRTWAGVDEGTAFLDALDITVDEHSAAPWTPHERAVHDREVAFAPDIQADPAFDPWRDTVTTTGFHALAVVPIEHDAELYGLLAVYGDRPRQVDDTTRELFEELGGDIAHAFYAIDTQRELEESEARYRNLAETASDAILRIDATSTITYANPATERVFGYSHEELVGEPLTMLMPEEFREKHRAGVERYLRTGERQLDWTGIELPGQHKDGTEMPLAISFGEFEQDEQQAFTGIIRDVSERESRRAALQRQVEYLDEFAGTVAHDLRNPLNIVSGHLELAREECDSHQLDVAMDTLERMDDLLDELLSFAQQDRVIDESEMDAVSVIELVDSALGEIDSESMGVTVEADPDLRPIVGSPSSVRALVVNLMRNAVEHGGSDVTIRVELLDDGFALEDDGPGILKAERDTVFEPGYTTKQTGTGFGLNIVKKIVDAHGWAITVTDGVDGGARFEITGVDIKQ